MGVAGRLRSGAGCCDHSMALCRSGHAFSKNAAYTSWALLLYPDRLKPSGYAKN